DDDADHQHGGQHRSESSQQVGGHPASACSSLLPGVPCLEEEVARLDVHVGRVAVDEEGVGHLYGARVLVEGGLGVGPEGDASCRVGGGLELGQQGGVLLTAF